MGTIAERRLVRYQQLAEHTEHIEQPELWHVSERLELDVAKHERLIEHERRDERQLVGHLQHTELFGHAKQHEVIAPPRRGHPRPAPRVVTKPKP